MFSKPLKNKTNTYYYIICFLTPFLRVVIICENKMSYEANDIMIMYIARCFTLYVTFRPTTQSTRCVTVFSFLWLSIR